MPVKYPRYWPGLVRLARSPKDTKLIHEGMTRAGEVSYISYVDQVSDLGIFRPAISPVDARKYHSDWPGLVRPAIFPGQGW